TIILENRYPIYRHRDTRQIVTYKVNSYKVMLYNPYLSYKYTAYINIEICTSMKSIKYIYKYIYKRTN
ncbi:uncharacterized protein THITE_2056835, partial [Thermothielavioides terrestris NRRL 8126]